MILDHNGEGPKRFAHLALRLAGHSARLLGWRPDEFWHATPADLAHALADPNAAQGGFDRSDLTRLMENDDNG